MTYLLDTNIVVLALTDDPALPDEAREDSAVADVRADVKWKVEYMRSGFH